MTLLHRSGPPRWPAPRAACGAAAGATLAGVLACLLAGCSAPITQYQPEPVIPQDTLYDASFDCSRIEVRWQAYACRDATLAAADRRLRDSFIMQLRRQDLAGRGELLVDQHHWQLGLYARCGVDSMPARGTALPAAPLACLQQAWQQRIAALQAYPAPSIPPWDPARGDHPLASYVAFRQVQSVEPPLCSDATARLNRLVAEAGEVDPGRSPGWRLVAGNHGMPGAKLTNGSQVDVGLHDAGPFGGFQLRATGLTIDGAPLLDDRTLPAWLLELPNAEGSFTSVSSETRDYAAIDVFEQGARVLVLVAQPWGYYASAARGESPHAALYEFSGGSLQRRCLWRTYTTPPVAQMLRFLPQFKALKQLLDEASGPDSPNLAPDDRRDAAQLATEAQWRLLNMPHLTLDEAARAGRWDLLRQRNDEALEALFAWSERNVACKQLYRKLMPLIAVAHDELARGFEADQGLKPDQARQAADLVLMSALARAAEHWLDPSQPRPAVGAVGAGYAPRYAAAPQAGDLEQSRTYGGLHSALVNRAPAKVIDALLGRPTARPGEAPGDLGPAGDTPLMAAVRSPEVLGRLIERGADVNARNAWGKTALMAAAQADQPDSVERLLAAGADRSMRTVAWQLDGAGGPDNGEGATPGRTVLSYAAGSAQATLIDRLLAGAAPDEAERRVMCGLLDRNSRLNDADRARLRGAVCPKP
jgi:hypothetical protein